MKKIILIVAIILTASGCTSYNSKNFQENFFPKNSVTFCYKTNDNNECKSGSWNESLFASINKNTKDWQLVTYYGLWSGYVRVFYGKVATNQADEAILEVQNFIKWAELPNDERISKKEEFEKNIKLNVIGKVYFLSKDVPYVQMHHFAITPYWESGYYNISLPVAKLILADLLKWKATLN